MAKYELIPEVQTWYDEQVVKVKAKFAERRKKSVPMALGACAILFVMILALQIYLGVDQGKSVVEGLVGGLGVSIIATLIIGVIAIPLCLLMNSKPSSVYKVLQRSLNRLDETAQKIFIQEMKAPHLYEFNYSVHKEDCHFIATEHFLMDISNFYNIVEVESNLKHKIDSQVIQGQSMYKIVLVDGEHTKKVKGVFSFPSEAIRDEILCYVRTRFDVC